MFRNGNATPKRHVALNIQTTGLSAELGDRIIEIAALEYLNGKATGSVFITTLNPEGKEISQAATACHGLTNAQLETSPNFFYSAERLIDFIAQDEVIVHSAHFTQSFIDYEMQRRKTEAPLRKVQLQNDLSSLQCAMNHMHLTLAEDVQNEPHAQTLRTLQHNLDEVKLKIAACEMIENSDWPSLAKKTKVTDIMRLDQTLHRGKAGYSHKLNDMCSRYEIDAAIEHSAQNRAKLIMQLYLQLSRELTKKYKQEQRAMKTAASLTNQSSTMFATVQKTDAPGVAPSTEPSVATQHETRSGRKY